MKNSVDIEFTRQRGKHTAKQFYSNQNLYKQYCESGAQYRMTFLQFKKSQRKKYKKKG